jgi:hypothetical protein
VGVFQFIRQVIGSALFSVWYLWALAGCDIIFQFMVRIKANKVWMISLFFLILLAIPDFWLFHYIKFIIPFYAFGYFVSKNGIDPQGSFSWKVILPFVAVFVVAWTLWTPACYVNTTKTHISSTTIIPILIRYFGGIGGGVTLFLVFRILQRHTGFTLFGKVASKIGRHSLTIYLLHILFVSYTSLLLFPKNYFVAFAIALVVVGICLLMEILILRIPFAPILLLGKKLKPAKS